MKRDPIVVTGVHLPSATAPPGERPPFALGMVMAYARKVFGSDEAFDVEPRFATSTERAERILATPGRHVFLYSDYMWSANENLELSRRLKSLRPDVVNIHGGPHVPSYADRCEAYLRDEMHVDFAVRGEGELPLVDLLHALREGDAREAIIPNVATLVRGRFVQHPSRERPRDLDSFPSPYLDGTLDPLEPERWSAGIVETNRGCPYGCTFCDWGAATLQKIRTFDLERIRAEVEWLAERRIPILWTADANFGILPRDVEVARIIVAAKKKYGFPQVLVTNYAKNTHQHLIDILEMYVEAGLVSTGIISIQTRDPSTLGIIRRKNIKTREYDKLRTELHRRGLPLAVQLMIGLPGASLRAMKDDLAFHFDEPIEVQMFRTVCLPNSPMAEPSYMAAHEIVHRADGLVTSTKTMSEADFVIATGIGRVFNTVHHYGVLRYPIVFLLREHGIEPLELMHDLVRDAPKGLLREMLIPDADPLNFFEPPSTLLELCRSGDRWSELCEEFFGWLRSRHDVPRSSAWDAVCAAQCAVMPSANRTGSVTALPHDVASWYADGRAGRRRALESYGPATLATTDPNDFSTRPYVMQRITRRHWELASALGTARLDPARAPWEKQAS